MNEAKRLSGRCEAGTRLPAKGNCPVCGVGPGDRCAVAAIREQHELIALREFVGWVDSWVSNPVGAYSVSALDGLFGMTRDKIAALNPPTKSHLAGKGEL